MAKRIAPKKNAAATPTQAASLREKLRRATCWRPGERIAVAVSGGADSVALLRLLLEMGEQLGIVLSVAHLNHQLRGRASDADERFVAALAAQHGLDFHLERVNIAAKAKREKANLEDAARRARYDFFSRLIGGKKAARIAVAHTADDQAETVLAHILRGTGLAGLGGIHPQTEHVVRPLLHIRRAALRTYLRSKKQTWREDATNQDISRLRARIRKTLLPFLEKQFQPTIVEHLVSLAEFAREDEALLNHIADQHCQAAVQNTAQGMRVPLALFSASSLPSVLKPTRSPNPAASAAAHRALTKRLLRRLIDESRTHPNKENRPAQITARHILAVLELAQHGENGKVLQLPGVEVRRERDTLLFSPPNSPRIGRGRKGAPTPELAYTHQIDFQHDSAAFRFATPRCALRFTAIDWPPNRVDTRVLGTVLDRDRLRFPLTLRNWRPGDTLQPAGHQKAHKLKRLFNEQRVSRWERQGWPVLASGGKLVWARGFPVAADFAAGGQTRAAIVIAEEP